MKEPTKIFFDTAPIIYYIEDNQIFASKVEKLLEKFEKQKLMINSIVYTELCIKPKRENNKQLIFLFDDFLNNLRFEILTIDKKCAIIAIDLMAKYQQIKTVDAIHIASAIAHNCDTFVTNDKQLKQIKEINILVLSEIEN